MTGKYDATAGKIMTLVGGKENVQSLTHCVTRLRFVLMDTSKADKEKLSKIEYVLTVLDSGGQLQVVVGNKVSGIYDAIVSEYEIAGGGKVATDEVTSEPRSLR